jgi:anti-anti-sigma regulatory factor
MVFSFFKKPPNKMPERVAVKPKAAGTPMPASPVSAPLQSVAKPHTSLPELEFTYSPTAETSLMPPSPQLSARPPVDEDFKLELTIGEFNHDFSDSSVTGFKLDHDVDSMQADIEQVAVLYSNGQDATARSLLETFVKIYRNADGVRIWLMLFDLLQLAGDHAAFDQLGMAFVEVFETSPPAWRNLAPALDAEAPGGRSLALKGVVTAESHAALAPLLASLTDKRPLRINCSQWIGCDDEIAGQLVEHLANARKRGIAVIFDALDIFLPRLRSRLVAGDKSHKRIWLLVLELLQYHGSQEQFEACAIDFAVTFERSPPSWERIEAVSALVGSANSAPERRDAHYLSGDIKNARFDELSAVLGAMEAPRLDFSQLRRLDFFSAGQLANRLSPLKEAGRDVLIRNPNHLVAELLGVVGINRIARIIVPKS